MKKFLLGFFHLTLLLVCISILFTTVGYFLADGKLPPYLIGLRNVSEWIASFGYPIAGLAYLFNKYF